MTVLSVREKHRNTSCTEKNLKLRVWELVAHCCPANQAMLGFILFLSLANQAMLGYAWPVLSGGSKVPCSFILFLSLAWLGTIWVSRLDNAPLAACSGDHDWGLGHLTCRMASCCVRFIVCHQFRWWVHMNHVNKVYKLYTRTIQFFINWVQITAA